VARYVGRRAEDRRPQMSAEIRHHGWIGIALLAALASLWFLSWAKSLLIPLGFAVFLTVCLSPAVRLLRRIRVPQAIGAAIVLIVISSLLAVLAEQTRGQVVQVVDELPTAARHLRHEIDQALNNPGSMAHRLKVLVDLPYGAESLSSHAMKTTPPQVQAIQTTLAQDTWQFLSLTGEIAAILFLIYLMLAAGGSLRNRIAHMHFIPVHTRECIRLTFLEVTRSLHQYLVCLVLTNALLGIAVWGAFALLGVHYAGAWGFAAAVLHFIPYVGPIAIAVGSTVFAAVQFDSLVHGMMIGGVTVLLSTLICVVLQTWLTGRSVRMNTVAVFVSLLFWSWIWGLPGLVLAIPIMIVIKAICSQIPQMEWFDALLAQRRRRRPSPSPSAARATQLAPVPRDGAVASGFALPEVTSPRR
jgi:predicted PurR-regulated permease PerM